MIENRPVVKTFRTAFLILLALLLPIRGAVAGAMLCPQGHGPAIVAQASKHAGHYMHGDTGAAHHHEHQGAADHGEQAGQANACNICVAFCSMTPMLSTMPTLVPAMLAFTLSFPELAAAPPRFQPDGLDRPPRSI